MVLLMSFQFFTSQLVEEIVFESLGAIHSILQFEWLTYFCNQNPNYTSQECLLTS